MNRALSTLLLAAVLIVAVLVVTTLITFSGLANNAKYAYDEVWRQDYSGALSLKIIDLTGDGQDDLFVQNGHSLSIVDAAGSELFRQSYSTGVSTTMGDVNGDGTEDVVVFDESGTFALTGTGEGLWEAFPEDVGTPYRAAIIRFPSGRQVLLGDDEGQVIALDARGQPLWRGATTIVDYIRGLDEVLVDGTTQVAVANHNGMIKVFDETGAAQWEYSLSGFLRRMRAYDLDGDGTSEILAGGDGNRLVMLSADTGEELLNRGLGQAITEIREAELDGEPSSREFVVGGKEGGVWAFNADGRQLWSASVSEKVNEIAGLDLDDDGAQEVVVGDDNGLVVVFSGTAGTRQTLGTWPTAIGRIDAGRLSGSDQIVVADLTSLSLLDLRKARAPLWYSPLLAGLIVSFVIAGAAWFVATLPPKPVLRVAAEDQSVEGLLTRNRMLHESLADVERLRGTSEMPAEAYLARLRDLRGELATTQATLLKAGHNLRLETFKCPNCGGTLPLGMDKCEYCGQITIA